MAYTALYPGTFDPLTFGHLDMMMRASMLCTKLIVGVAENPGKNPLFSLEQRKLFVELEINKMKAEGSIDKTVEVQAFKGLLTDFAKQVNASMLIRGLRAVSDFEYEFQMAQMNRHLNDSIETVYLMPTEEHFFTSSNLIKQVFKFTDREKQLIPENVHQALVNYYKNN